MLRPRQGRLALTARALLWRRGSTITLLLVATVTTAAAALGPLYARAAGESTLRDTLTTAPADQTGLSFQSDVDISSKSAVSDLEGVLPRPGSVQGYPGRLGDIQVHSAADVIGGQGPVDTVVAWREGQCAHVVITKGACPSAAGQVMVSERTLAGGYGFALGRRVQLVGLPTDHVGPAGNVQLPLVVTVVGVYRPVDAGDRYWFGRNYFNAHFYTGLGDGPDTIDDVFVDAATFPTLSRDTTGRVAVDYPLDATQIRLDDEPALLDSVRGLQQQYSPAGAIQLQSQLPAVLAVADHERDLLDVSTVLVTLQLALLAWLVLFQVVADAAESRGNEIALAKLRGLPATSTIAFGLGEPFLVLVLAIPLGLVVGWIAVSVLARLVLVPGTPVVLTAGAVLGALAGFAGAAVGAALAARRVLTRPVLEQWRRVPQGDHTGVASLVVDGLVVVAAVAGLVALRSGTAGTEPRPISLLGPGLLVLAVALLGVRLLPLAGRAAVGPTRASSRVGAFLAVRQVVRRPAGLRLAALLAVAIGLATFAIDGEAVAASNRSARAAVEVGANQVVKVQYATGHDPLEITRKVDPAGAWSMAAATWIPSGGPMTGTLLGVDTTRLATVANWPASDPIDAATAAARVGPPVPDPLMISGSAVRVTIQQVSRGPGPPPNVSVLLRPEGKKDALVRLGPLSPGTVQYSAAVPCAAGCTLMEVVLDRPIDYFGQMTGSVVVTSVEQQTAGSWRPVDARLTRPGEWRAAGTPATSTDTLSVTAQGLRDDFSSSGGASNALGHVDSPKPLPMLTTPGSINRGSAAGPPVLVDQSAASAAYAEVGSLPLLPAVLDDGVLVDVRYVRAQLVDFDNEAHWQVWLGPQAPSDAVQRLTAAGLLVQSVRTQAERTSELGRQGPALALLLLVACAIAGAVLAAGATALAVAVTGRRRSFELAALAAVGVKRKALLRSCTLEQLILLGTGFVLGLPTGIIAARLALPAIPEYSDSTPVPLSFAPHVVALAVFAVTVLVVLVVTALVAGRVLMRSAVPTRLREAEQ